MTRMTMIMLVSILMPMIVSSDCGGGPLGALL